MSSTGSLKCNSSLALLPVNAHNAPKRNSCPDNLDLMLGTNTLSKVKTPDQEVFVQSKDLSETQTSNTHGISNDTEYACSTNQRTQSTKQKRSDTTSVNVKLAPTNTGEFMTQASTTQTSNNSSTKFAKKWKWLLKKYRNHKLHVFASKSVHGSHSFVLTGKTHNDYGNDHTPTNSSMGSMKQRKSSVPEITQSRVIFDWGNRHRQIPDDESSADQASLRSHTTSPAESEGLSITVNVPQLRGKSSSPEQPAESHPKRELLHRSTLLNFTQFNPLREKKNNSKSPNSSPCDREDKLSENELDTSWFKGSAERRKKTKMTAEAKSKTAQLSVVPSTQSLTTSQNSYRTILNKLFRSNWPSLTEVQSWSQSFSNILHDRAGILLFREFLRTEFSDENIEFWLICEEFRKSCGAKKLQSKAQKIFNEYVAVQSKREVNLDSTTRIQLEKELESVTRNTFDQSQKRIQALMEKDSYCRFLRSDLYMATLECCRTLSSNCPEICAHLDKLPYSNVQVPTNYEPDSAIPGLLPNVKSLKEIATASSQHETGSFSAPSSPKQQVKNDLLSTDIPAE